MTRRAQAPQLVWGWDRLFPVEEVRDNWARVRCTRCMAEARNHLPTIQADGWYSTRPGGASVPALLCPACVREELA